MEGAGPQSPMDLLWNPSSTVWLCTRDSSHWVSASTFVIWADPSSLFTPLTTLKKQTQYSASQRASIHLTYNSLSHPNFLQRTLGPCVLLRSQKQNCNHLQVPMQNHQQISYVGTKESPTEGSKQEPCSLLVHTHAQTLPNWKIKNNHLRVTRTTGWPTASCAAEPIKEDGTPSSKGHTDPYWSPGNPPSDPFSISPQWTSYLGRSLYLFPAAAVTNHYTLSGLQHKLIIALEVRSLKRVLLQSNMKVSGAPFLPGSLREHVSHCLQLLEATCLLGSMPHITPTSASFGTSSLTRLPPFPVEGSLWLLGPPGYSKVISPSQDPLLYQTC